MTLKKDNRLKRHEAEREQPKSDTMRLAAKIARDLFTDGSGRRASRLEMRHLQNNGLEMAGAGWSEDVVRDRIAKMLLPNTKLSQPSK